MSFNLDQDEEVPAFTDKKPKDDYQLEQYEDGWDDDEEDDDDTV